MNKLVEIYCDVDDFYQHFMLGGRATIARRWSSPAYMNQRRIIEKM